MACAAAAGSNQSAFRLKVNLFIKFCKSHLKVVRFYQTPQASSKYLHRLQSNLPSYRHKSSLHEPANALQLHSNRKVGTETRLQIG